MMSPIHRRPLTVLDCDLPDEYVDAVVSFDAACDEYNSGSMTTRSSRDDDDQQGRMTSPRAIFRSFVPQNWLEQHHGSSGNNHGPVVQELKLSECDIPDEYVDAAAVISFDDNDGKGAAILSVKLGETIGSLNCLSIPDLDLRDDDDDAVALNDCDLPDTFVPAEVSCSSNDSPRRRATRDDETMDKQEVFRRRSSSSKHTTVTTTTTTTTSSSPTTLLPNNNDPSNASHQHQTEEWTSGIEEEMVPSMTSLNESALLRQRHAHHPHAPMTLSDL